jgi:hypothetical protein
MEIEQSDYEENAGSARGSWYWQYWIPAILLGIFLIWHLGTPVAERIKARIAWHNDRAELVESYARMQDANLRDDLAAYLLGSEKADLALSQLRDNLGKLQDTSGQWKREQFIQGSSDCLKDMQFNLTPPKQKASEYCQHLIQGL